MVMLCDSRPWPLMPMPSPSRTGLRFPSAATTYLARTELSVPLSRSRTTAVTPSASCSSDVHSARYRSRALSSVARARRIGSSGSWLMNSRTVGLNASTLALRFGK
jgi:hypothetical protein